LAIDKNPIITIIISVYKNTQALEIVLDSLAHQSVMPDEIIISEDGNSNEMKEFVSSLSYTNIIHLTQEDDGWQKAVALNNSIRTSKGDYLIFIDGDVVPHKRFIEGHLACSEKRKVCCGKRSELGEGITKKIYNHELNIDKLTSSYIRQINTLHKDGIRHYEEGFYISPKNIVHKLFLKDRHVRYIIGCNFSCYKEDIESINGFDEDYKYPAIGEDIDLGWRFRGLNIDLKSCRNIANVYHLWHKKNFGSEAGEINNKILEKNFAQNRFVCLNGLNKSTQNKGEQK
jgi:GT2 family glycosyltransferase